MSRIFLLVSQLIISPFSVKTWEDGSLITISVISDHTDCTVLSFEMAFCSNLQQNY